MVQISALTRLTSHYYNWKLVDIYIDIVSGKTKSSRKEFLRMLEDIKKEEVNIIVTKSVSRFGRDTVDALEALKVIKQASARIIFELENLDSQEDDTDMIISIIESLAQSENEQRSENIRWGLKQRAAQGTSKLYNRKCYGYDHDENGELIINFQQAKIVKKIFNWYLDGKSVIGIVKELEKENIKSPTGKKQMAKKKY
ncbi:recombinase family protein [Lactobacillus iners]|uniref:recombinase family protein n=1 Tax=Lactobacillus iners TaxID=147802 RepID=UPI00336A57F5